MFISKKEFNRLRHDLEHTRQSYFDLICLTTALETRLDFCRNRLDHQEKMQKMLFAHLGIEYAKITEETKTGKQEKEVLRRIKKK